MGSNTSATNNNDEKQVELLRIKEIIENEQIEFIRFEQSDLHGTSRSKVVMAKHFRNRALNGQGFYPTLCKDPKWKTIRVEDLVCDQIADFVAFPDLKTFLPLPWSKNTARVIVDPTERDGSPLSTHPRWVARRQLQRLEDLGYRFLSAIEYEFYVLDGKGKPLNDDLDGLSTLRNGQYHELFNPMLRQLISAGIDVEIFEAETGPGQFEITHAPCWGISGADTAFTLRTAIKEMALQRGHQVTFMTALHEVTCSMAHFNHSLWDIHSDNAVFYDFNRPNKLSEIAEQWMAGILAHAQAITCLMAPTVNCWHKLVEQPPEQHIATIPINVSWGVDNRTAYLRAKNSGASGTYCEARAATSGANPYLILAALVAAGIDGIERRLALPPGVEGNAFKMAADACPPLPKGLGESLDALNEDKVMVEALGESFVKCFTAVKRHEIQVCSEQYPIDPDWDKKYYFNI